VAEFNIINSLLAGRQDRRAQDEFEYAQRRAAIDDAAKDETVQQELAARRARIDRFGEEAANVADFSNMRASEREEALQPGRLETQDLTNRGMRTTLDNNAQDRERSNMSRALGMLAQSGATDAASARAWVQRSSDGLARAFGDPDAATDIMQLIDLVGQNEGDFAQNIHAVRVGLGSPETVSQYLEGYDADGNLITMGIGSEAAPGEVQGVAPVGLSRKQAEEDRALEQKLLRAQINATNASAAASRASAAKKAGDDENDPYKIAGFISLYDKALADLEEAKNIGAVPTATSNPLDNLVGQGATIAGRVSGTARGAAAERVEANARAIFSAISQAGTGQTRLFDTPAEMNAMLSTLGNKGTYETRRDALITARNQAIARNAALVRAGKVPGVSPEGQSTATQTRTITYVRDANGNLVRAQ
jgi:hypothetical protein